MGAVHTLVVSNAHQHAYSGTHQRTIRKIQQVCVKKEERCDRGEPPADLAHHRALCVTAPLTGCLPVLTGNLLHPGPLR